MHISKPATIRNSNFKVYCIAKFIDRGNIEFGFIQIFDGENIDGWHLDSVCYVAVELEDI